MKGKLLLSSEELNSNNFSEEHFLMFFFRFIRLYNHI